MSFSINSSTCRSFVMDKHGGIPPNCHPCSARLRRNAPPAPIKGATPRESRLNPQDFYHARRDVAWNRARRAYLLELESRD